MWTRRSRCRLLALGCRVVNISFHSPAEGRLQRRASTTTSRSSSWPRPSISSGAASCTTTPTGFIILKMRGRRSLPIIFSSVGFISRGRPRPPCSIGICIFCAASWPIVCAIGRSSTSAAINSARTIASSRSSTAIWTSSILAFGKNLSTPSTATWFGALTRTSFRILRTSPRTLLCVPYCLSSFSQGAPCGYYSP